ncbi:MAG TPA: hypothetical protein VKT28_20900 [Puia sp.]|nr:hypothetical protein [Puia sp.]
MKSNIKIGFVGIFAIFIMMLYVSCSHKESIKQTTQNDDNSILNIIERYYKMQSTKTEGTFIFESNLTNNDPKITKTVLKGGFFNDVSGKFETDGGDVSIGGEVMTNKNGWYGFDKVGAQSGMYGTNVTFNLNPPKSQGGSGAAIQSQGDAGYNQKQNQSSAAVQSGATTLSTSLYSPKPITITNIPAKSSIKLTPNTNTTLTWNADPLDSNGVVIIADYLPTRIFNYYTNKAGYTHALTSSELVPDNGSTTVPWSFFSQFPVGSHITLWVARGNYTILSNKDYSYKVGGYSAAAVWDVVIPAPPLTITASNYVNVSGFTVTYTNTSTSVKTYFTIPSGGGNLGTLPAGTYNISFSKPSNATKYAFASCDGSSVIGTTATFNNVVINSNCSISISDPNHQP